MLCISAFGIRGKKVQPPVSGVPLRVSPEGEAFPHRTGTATRKATCNAVIRRKLGLLSFFPSCRPGSPKIASYRVLVCPRPALCS